MRLLTSSLSTAIDLNVTIDHSSAIDDRAVVDDSVALDGGAAVDQIACWGEAICELNSRLYVAPRCFDILSSRFGAASTRWESQAVAMSAYIWPRIMAKLYFYYSSMNAGKSAALLQSSYNYQERGLETLLLTPRINDRDGSDQITSRIGISAPAATFDVDDDLFVKVGARANQSALHCVMIDEAQFLTKVQVHQLGCVCDELDIPVLAYGLRTDFQGEPFEGSRYLLAWADNLKELKAICHCGRKATMVLRVDASGRVMTTGEQVAIGGNAQYVSVCRRHFFERFSHAS